MPNSRRVDRARSIPRAAAVLASICALIGSSCAPPDAPIQGTSPSAEDWFEEVPASSGLDFVHFNGRSGQLYLAEITCGGGGLVDVDGDGDLDVYVSQGRMLGPGRSVDDAFDRPRHPLPLSDRLYRNDRTIDAAGRPRLRFTDITDVSGIAEATRGYGCGVAAGDLDNDGDNDLLVLMLGGNRLLMGNGDGTFADVTAAAGLDPEDGRSSVGASIADVDGDGWLDIFVVNNLTFRYDGASPCFDLAGAPDYCGPGAFAPQADTLWRNLGQRALRFVDATAAAGLAASTGPGLGVVSADFDDDGRMDLYVANDGQPNFLWRNEGRPGAPAFTESALLAGAGVNAEGAAEASMGVDAGDVDGDGDLDLVLAHLAKETHTLYVNEGGVFDDRSRRAGLAAPSLPATGFGAVFFDVENDGDLDLFVANGAVIHRPELVRRGDPFPIHQPNQLFLNHGAATFEDATAEAGDALARSEVSRAAVAGDIDNDGVTDLLVVNNGGSARLLINRVGHDRAWLGLRLVGGPSSGVPDAGRDMLGALVTLSLPEGKARVARVATDGSYGASHDPRVRFGLGTRAEKALPVEVRWPDGQQERFSSVPTGRYVTLRQGEGEEADP